MQPLVVLFPSIYHTGLAFDPVYGSKVERQETCTCRGKPDKPRWYPTRYQESRSYQSHRPAKDKATASIIHRHDKLLPRRLEATLPSSRSNDKTYVHEVTIQMDWRRTKSV